MKKIVPYFTLLFLCLINFSSFTIVHGQVKIGEQVWMSANLNTSKFQNGDPIFEAKTKEQWANAAKNKKAAWCYYKNSTENGTVYGKLYNWYAVNDPRGLAPKGWHVPTKKDWNELIDHVKTVDDYVCSSLKTKSGWKKYEYGGSEEGSDCAYCNGTGQRYSSLSYKYIYCVMCNGTGGDRRYVEKRTISGNGTNNSGFAAKPGSNRFADGDFNKYLGELAVWWTSTELDAEDAYDFYVDNENNRAGSESKLGKGYGCSVRLIKDKSPEVLEKERLLEEEKKQKELMEQQRKEEERIANEKRIQEEKIAREKKIKEEERIRRERQEQMIRKQREEAELRRIQEKKEEEEKFLNNVVTVKRIIGKKELGNDFKGTIQQAEALLEKIGPNWRFIFEYEMNSLVDVNGMKGNFSSDRFLDWEESNPYLVKGNDSKYKEAHLTTNSIGWRKLSYKEADPKKSYNIFFLKVKK
jgi:uncharacterized protein (TIGR02145 family)